MAWHTGEPAQGSKPVSRYIRENFAWLKTVLDAVSVWATEFASHYPILGTSTVGQSLRAVNIEISDGSAANSIKVEITSNYNGDAVAEVDNITKGATVSGITLSAVGGQLTFDESLFDETISGILACSKRTDNIPAGVGANVYFCPYLNGADLRLFASSYAGAEYDLTSILDTGYAVSCTIAYITSE